MSVPVHDFYRQDELPLSNSSLNGTFVSCPRKLEFRKLYGHGRNGDDDSLAAAAGRCLHSAWQTWATTRNKQQALWELLRTYPIDMMPSANDERSIYAAYATFEEMLAHSLDARYQLASVMHNGEEKPAVEVPFRIHFPGVSMFPDRDVPICYDGYIDAIMWDTVERKFVVVDIKTTRKRRHDYSAMFGRDPQCLPYGYVLQKAVDQSYETAPLSVIYLVCYIDVREPRVIKYEFEKSAADIQAWAFSTAFQINTIRQFAQLGFFPKQGNSCDTYGVCPYNEVCDYTKPEAIRRYLDMKFGELNREQRIDPWFTINLTIEGLL